MKNKKAFTLLLVLFIAPITVYALSTAVTGSFKLTAGKVEKSDAVKVNLKYPYLSLDNNKSKDGVFSTVLRKSTLGIYSNKQRIDKISAGTKTKHIFFSNHGTGTYKVNIIGEEGTTAFDYGFTSSNSNK